MRIWGCPQRSDKGICRACRSISAIDQQTPRRLPLSIPDNLCGHDLLSAGWPASSAALLIANTVSRTSKVLTVCSRNRRSDSGQSKIPVGGHFISLSADS
jgi:hypothetical protein